MSNSNVGLHVNQCFAIFWDIENCPLPHGRMASNVITNIRQYINQKYVNCKKECTFCCATDSRKLDEKVVEAFNRNGVDILHVNSNRTLYKVDADSKLKEGIQKFVDHHSMDSTLFVITGDIDFAPAIRSAKRNGMKVILFYGQNTSQELKTSATESHSFYDVIKGPEVELIDENASRTSSKDAVIYVLRDIFVENKSFHYLTARLDCYQDYSVSETITPRLMQVVRIDQSSEPSINFGSGLTNDWWEKWTQPQLPAGQHSTIQKSLPVTISDSMRSIQQTPQTCQNPGASPRKSSQPRQQTTTMNLDLHQLSPEFTQKLEILQSITQVDRDLGIRLLQICKGNVEHAINTLYSDDNS